MTEFRIAVDISGLIPAGSPLNAATFPHLAFAVKEIAEAALRQWRSYASGEALPNGKVIQTRAGEYARSIMLRQRGDFDAEVYSDLPYARAIEEGTPQRDLKKMLGSSPKVRLTKDGRRYLIIPFRHNHPNSVLGNQMPQAVHDWWREPDRRPSHVTGIGQRVSGLNASDIRTRGPLMTPSRTYSWGTRLGKTDLAGIGLGGKAGKRYEGMVNFRKPGGEGGSAHSQFITFRVMREDSPGWIAPAREGLWPARTTADQLRPVAEEFFRKAIAEDVKAILGGQ